MDFLEELTKTQKVRAMMDYFGLTKEEAEEELMDMGEI